MSGALFFEIAIDRALDGILPSGTRETVPLASCAGRVLADDLVATRAVPPVGVAAMDGFGFAAATAGATLPIVGVAAAGRSFAGPVAPGSCVRIFTGAAIPSGVDTVAMREECHEETGTMRPPTGFGCGANIRPRGDDIAVGSCVLRAGTRLDAAAIAHAATLGREALNCHARLRVALFSTGTELADPGQSAGEDVIYDANRVAVRNLLEALGCDVTDLGIQPDDPQQIERCLHGAAATHDVVVTSGGMSFSESDHVRRIVVRDGVLRVPGVRMRPGKPIGIGRLGTAQLIGLPGNPAAAIVTLLLIAAPLLRRLSGRHDVRARPLLLPAGFAHRKPVGRTDLRRVRIAAGGDGFAHVEAILRDGSHMLASLIGSDGFALVPDATETLSLGDPVAFHAWRDLTW